MGYTVVRGGEAAIKAARALESAPLKRSKLSVEAVLDGMRYAVDGVMGEAGLYAPELAARAIVEAQGDLAEAAFLLRAYSSTLPRVGYTKPANTASVRLVRRVSSAFKDVPGGQVLGATRDYSQRLLGLEQEEELPSSNGASWPDGEGSLPRITGLLRRAGLVKTPEPSEGEEPFDITRQALRVPAPRAARLQVLARGEPGAMGALAYSALRGFGAAHPTLAEFRVGHLPVKVGHPRGVGEVEVGEVLCTEAETVDKEAGDRSDGDREGLSLSLGYGLVFGKNERKAIEMAVLDAAIRAGNGRDEGPAGPAEDEEFVLRHTDGVEATGLIEHLKLPHYVTFQSGLDRLREVRRKEATADGKG